jgi:hypothetical protein
MAPRWVGLFALATIGSAAAPTFSKDVAPILLEHCATCHRAGQIGPMPLMTYDQARPWAKAIRTAVALGKMPPWNATQPRGVFSNDRRLSPHDRETLIAWADGGAPQGDTRDLPPIPRFFDGWEIGTPDVVLTMPKAFKVPAWGTIDYQYVSLPTHFTEDKWVQSLEVRSTGGSVLHHVVLYNRAPGDDETLPGVFTQVVPKTLYTPSTWLGAALIATAVPGVKTATFPAGSAVRMKAGSVLVLQIHYTANGEPAENITSVGLIFAKQAPRREIHFSAFYNTQFVLRPGDPDTEVDSAIEFTRDVHIAALGAHSHLRGKSWEYLISYPDGRNAVVLSLPDWNPNWQTFYQFEAPLAAPKGTRLKAVAHFDNSGNNPLNPDPRAEVRWGNQIVDEMQFSAIAYTVDQPVAESAAAPSRK